MRSIIKISALIAVITAAVSLPAQTAPSPAPVTIGMQAVAPVMPGGGPMMSLKIDALDATPVKGAPFCGTITTEHTQGFADGNRIHTSDNSTLCRDNDGRIRREAGLNLLSAAGQIPDTKLITIIDPVAGFRYMLDTNSKTAHRMPIPKSNSASITSVGEEGLAQKSGQVMIVSGGAGAPDGPNVFYHREFAGKDRDNSDGAAPTTESLGDQTFDGVHATGTRMTTTIPAGKMGNDQPITVTTERWYSSELKATVMTKHDDPWAGELKTQLTSVNTSQPDASLFTVPSDYMIVDEKDEPFKLQPLLPPPPPAR